MPGLAFLVRTGTYFGMLLGLLFAEQLAPRAPSAQRKSGRIRFHLGIGVANGLVLYLVMTGPTVAAIFYAQGHRVGAARLLGLSGWWEVAATIVLLDIWDYWMHRAFHKIPFMWRFHRAHHSDMELDVTTSARFHIGELVLSGCSKCLMILLWGPSLWGVVAFDMLLNIASQFHHSNVAIPIALQDRIERLVVTPRMHQCHHALHRDCFNTNFATILSVWDRLFGSYRWSRDKSELEVMGLSIPRGEETMKFKPFLLSPLLL